MRRLLRILLYSLLAIVAGLLAIRFVAGPFRTPLLGVNSPMNVGAIAALSFLMISMLAAEVPLPGEPPAAGRKRGSEWAVLVLIALAVALSFRQNLGAPFVFDDYTHLAGASHNTWRILTDAFQPERGGRGLSRPVGFIVYWLDFQWAGVHPERWHLWSLTVHLANTGLLYFLLRRLHLACGPAAVAGLLFGLHGSRAETVAWVDARFDLLATLFVLGSLLLLVEYCRTGRRGLYIPLAVCAVLAACTKESAFCLPLLPAALLPVLPDRRRALRACLVLAGVCGAVFAYRWWAVGGIGGYFDRTGLRAFWQSRPLHAIESLFYRQWAFLFFPVNWSVAPEWWLSAAAVLFLAALVGCAWQLRPSRAWFLAGLATLLAASLPVHQILMFQSDFAGARVLYLPVAGLAIVWAALLQRASHPIRRWVLGAALLTFNIAALQHNLAPWRTTPAASVAVCRTLGAAMANDPRPVYVSHLPDRRQGVYFLANGFPECVALNAGQPSGRIHVVSGPAEAPADGRSFVWNAGKGAFEERR